MNNIMRDDPKAIRSLGLQTLKGNWTQALIVVLVAQLILSFPSSLAVSIGSGDIMLQLLYVYSVIMQGPVTLGAAYYFLRLFRGEHAEAGDMRFGLAYIAKGMMLFFNIAGRVVLWSFLFLIPGFIKAIEFSQCFFILAEDPRRSIPECMYMSRAMMYGNRMHFFNFMLGFAPWMILALAPQAAYNFITNAENMQQIMELGAYEAIQQGIYVPADGLISFFLTIGTLAVYAYSRASSAAYYDILSGGLLVEDEAAMYSQDFGGYDQRRVIDVEPNDNGRNSDE